MFVQTATSLGTLVCSVDLQKPMGLDKAVPLAISHDPTTDYLKSEWLDEFESAQHTNWGRLRSPLKVPSKPSKLP